MKFSFQGDDVAALPPDQKTAILESLLIALFADGHAAEKECEQFNHQVEAINWGVDRTALLEMLTTARARVASVTNAAQAGELIRSAAGKLTNPDIRVKVFRAMGAINAADGTMAKTELKVLADFAQIFQLTKEQVDEVKADVIASQKT